MPLSSFGQNTSNHGNKFEQLGALLPTGNTYRGMDGAPGPAYWQQQCNYDIECELDVEQLRLTGSELITYFNNSPNTLTYLWLQLDENQHASDNVNQRFDPTSLNNGKPMSAKALRALESWREMDKYGVHIESVTDINRAALSYVINNTLMRVELPQPLKSGEHTSLRIKWNYHIPDRNALMDFLPTFANYPRGGYEYFPDDKNYLFTISQWYPRLCAYTDYEGWQNNQFTGQAEFALTFGNYVVKMTVPDDHIVASTGECLNYSTVLTPLQLERWKQAQTAEEPFEIVTLKEAKKTEKIKKNQ